MRVDVRGAVLDDAIGDWRAAGAEAVAQLRARAGREGRGVPWVGALAGWWVRALCLHVRARLHVCGSVSGVLWVVLRVEARGRWCVAAC